MEVVSRGVVDLISSDGEESLYPVMDDTKEFLQTGKGRYNTDGSYSPGQKMFGEKIVPVTRTHRRVREAVHEAIRYSQGVSHIVQKLDENNLVSRHPDNSKLYDDKNIFRTQLLLNEYYKSHGESVGVTLSTITSWSLTNNCRNRAAMRDVVAPVFEYYGLWTVRRDKSGHANFEAGPLLILFAERVLDLISDYDLKE